MTNMLGSVRWSSCDCADCWESSLTTFFSLQLLKPPDISGTASTSGKERPLVSGQIDLAITAIS